MKKLITFSLSFVFLLVLASCGGSKKDRNAILNDKKVALEKLKNENESIDAKIKKLQQEISLLDGGASAQKPKLVEVTPLQNADFNHYIDLQAVVDAENISYAAPRNGGGLIKQIYVKQGQRVSKGQLLLRMDNAVQMQNVTAAKQGLATIRTQLAFAKNVYQRQKNLWEKNIGTEVQLLTAKSNVETLETQLATANANVKLVQEQANGANVYSDVSGVADVVTVRPGELFTGSNMGGGVIKIVNTSNLKVKSTIPENYLGSVKMGTPVEVEFPDLGKTIKTQVSFLGASIDPNTRGFIVEAKLPNSAELKPNQIALIKIRDYAATDAITIPVNTLQTDDKGKFVMLAKTQNGKLVAKKQTVNIGALNGNRLEIKTGLASSDTLITDGFQGLYDGQLISTQ